jgi:hypothetical protein
MKDIVQKDQQILELESLLGEHIEKELDVLQSIAEIVNERCSALNTDNHHG